MMCEVNKGRGLLSISDHCMPLVKFIDTFNISFTHIKNYWVLYLHLEHPASQFQVDYVE